MARGKGFEFCCCAIPLINVGAYFVVLEVALVSFILGVLSIATHPITAGEGVIPSFAKIIIAALAFITFLWQIVGIVSIRTEATTLYHTYVRISTLLTCAIIGVATAFAVIAAVRHSTAQSTCIANYGALPSTTSTGLTNSSLTQNFGSQICNYFLWAQTGVMLGLVVFMGLIQLYMCFASRAYGVAQRSAARDSKSGYRAPDDEIPLSSRSVPGGFDYDGRSASPTWQEPKHRSLHNASASQGGQSAVGVGAAQGPYRGHAATESGDAGWATGEGNRTGYPAYAGGAASAQAAQHGAYPAYPAYETRPY
ncbi:unnamed protein product [Parajaminaea phylloscopi]